jgi:hypothetical protein
MEAREDEFAKRKGSGKMGQDRNLDGRAVGRTCGRSGVTPLTVLSPRTDRPTA